ncbi:hypothetical protein [Duganella vulcania]|uniref:Uncharacterized protein n=1 Tax=Duganella vulcania TaxID=2692166 RepID=A0A845GJ59_9BURK|nr:hypothetical protein [Duganella vulcania]MYM92777.1 hypothetical protein [Duganella vulcania]
MGHKAAATLIALIVAACAASYASLIRRLWINNMADNLRHFWKRQPGGVTSAFLYAAIGATWVLGFLTGLAAICMAASITCLLEATGEILYRRKIAPDFILPPRQRT